MTEVDQSRGLACRTLQDEPEESLAWRTIDVGTQDYNIDMMKDGVSGGAMMQRWITYSVSHKVKNKALFA